MTIFKRHIAIIAVAFGVATTSAASDEYCQGRQVGPIGVIDGPVCVPEDPRRIATLDPFYNFQMAVSLGMPVVATTRSGDSLPTAIEDLLPGGTLGEIVDLGQFQEPDVEALLRVRPDVILGDAFMHRDFLEQLSLVAPTVLVEQPDWKDYLRTVAAVGGRLDEAEAQLTAYEQQAAGIAGRVPEDLTMSFVRVIPGGFQVYMDGPAAYAPFGVLRDAGIKRPAFETVSDDTVLKRPTLEGLTALTGDVLIFAVGGGHDDAGSGRLREELFAQPVWQALPAVRAGRAFEVDVEIWMSFGGLHSARLILEDLDRILQRL